MLVRSALLFALLSAATTILSGAWFSSAAPTMQNRESDFTPQNVPLATDVVGSGTDAASLLEKAIARLDANRTGWLSVKIRQTKYDARTPVVAEGFLQRGPDQCARLEMDVITNKSHGRLTMVSDGAAFAKVQSLPNAADTVVVEHLPSSAKSAEREDFLTSHGCGGPAALLRQLRNQIKDATLQTGMLGDRAVIQICGVMPESPAMRVYLDASTLALVRVECSESNMRIEFSDLKVGCELTQEECARLFSYQPAGHERMANK